MSLIYFIVGAVIGSSIAYFFLIQRKKGLSDLNKERINIYISEIEISKKEIQNKETIIIELNKELATKKAENHNIEERLNEHKKEIENIREKFSIEFKNLANDIFEEKSKKFTEQNKINLTDILKPLNEKIKDFEKKVDETYDKEAQQRFSLKEEVKRLAELNQQISKEASNLTKALKGESKTQGTWGEIILESILEKSGLVKDREYFIQASYTNEEGRRLQPDVLVKYPGDRNIIIDSKVSLTAYERYISEEDEKQKEIYLKAHLLSIRTHIDSLNRKSYQDIYQLHSLDFVMMFLPIEPAYMIAVQADKELWQFAYDKRILLISPTNLITSLKMVVSLWRQEYQNRNAEEIAKKSGELYDKLVGLVDDLIDIGNKLRQTQISYEDSMNKLTSGKGNLIRKAQDIKELGIKTKKNIPQNILDRSNTDQ